MGKLMLDNKHTSDVLLASILDEALDILNSRDLLTKDIFPIIQEALKSLDDLHDRLGNYHSSVFPRDARQRLGEIRGVLRVAGVVGDPREAFRDLQALADEIRRVAEELEG